MKNKIILLVLLLMTGIFSANITAEEENYDAFSSTSWEEVTIAEEIAELSGNVMRLAQTLNALCANMAGAEADSPKELPNVPLLQKLGMLTDGTRYCLERADTLMRIMGQ